MEKRLIIILLATLALFHSGLAQYYPTKNLRMHDGLCNSIVFRVTQDKLGFIWLCTDYGLSRFDGKTFKNYYSANGLPHNTIMSMSSHKHNKRFVCTYGGGVAIADDTVISTLKVKGGKIPDKALYAEDVGEDIWIISTNINSLVRISHDTASEVAKYNPEGIPIRFRKIIKFNSDAFFTSSSGVYRLVSGDSIQPFLPDILKGEIFDFRPDNTGGYWAGMEGRIVHVKGEKITAQYAIRSKLPVRDIEIDNRGHVWAAGADNGVFLIRDNKAEEITNELRLPNVVVHDIFEDNTGNIWFATGGQGVYMLSSLNVITYPVQGGQMKSYCSAIEPLNASEVLVGSTGALSILKEGELSNVRLNLLSPVDHIYFVKRWRDKIYVGTPKGLLIKHLAAPYKERMIAAKNQSLVGALSFSEGDSTLFVGAFSTIYEINSKTEFLDDAQLPICLNRCNSIMKTREGQLWLGTDSGIVMYQNDLLSFQRVANNRWSNAVNAMLEDDVGRKWVATDSGLFFFENNKFHEFQPPGRPAPPKINALAYDKCGTIWAGTVRGAFAIDVRTMNSKKYQSGIFANEVLSLYATTEKLFVGFVDGLSVLSLKQEDEILPPPVYITAIRIPGRTIDLPTSVSLPFRRNRLIIEYAALSYSMSEEVDYRYRITNLNDNWQLTKATDVNLPSLPAGEYIFELSARVNNGPWSKSATLPVKIDEPFWQNKLLLLLTGISVSWAIYFLTRRTIEKRELAKRRDLKLLNKIAYLKQQALSAQINPHFIFNCMNSIQHYLHDNDRYRANMYLSDFAQLIRLTLEHSKSTFINLNEELERLGLYLSLEQLRFGNELKYEITVSDDLLSDTVRIPNMILQPYVENAIWHGIMPKNGVGKISIRVGSLGSDKVRVVIADNGVGIKRDKKKQSNHEQLGMKLTKDRLLLLQKLLGQEHSVEVAQTNGENITGTSITITLPRHPNEDKLDRLDS